MILKMNKFVIYRRKFESKRSYINEDMNLMEFFRFFFKYFLNLFPYKKSQTGVYYLRGTREADVDQGGHAVEPREPTWTPTWHKVERADSLWAHGLVGLG